MQRVAILRQRNLAPAEMRLAHVDGDAMIAGAFGRNRPAQRFEHDSIGFVLLHQQRRDTASAIAASLCLAAIGIADAHEGGAGRAFRRLDDQDLVATDAAMAIANGARRAGIERQRMVARVENDEIVPEPVHFDEIERAHRGVIERAHGPTNPAAGHPLIQIGEAIRKAQSLWGPALLASRYGEVVGTGISGRSRRSRRSHPYCPPRRWHRPSRSPAGRRGSPASPQSAHAPCP